MSAKKERKMSKAKAKRQKEEEERRLQDEEEARQQQEREEQERQERERKEQELERLESKDQERREGELSEVHCLLEEIHAAVIKQRLEDADRAKWDRYTSCDNVPDPAVQSDINTYISLWTDDPEVSASLVFKECAVALQLVEELERLLAEVTDVAEGLRYRETLVCLQELVHSKLNLVAEETLKGASANTDLKGNMQAVVGDDNITMCLWANLKKNPRLRSCHFDEAGLGFQLPKQLISSDVGVRILHTRYDHLTMLARLAQTRLQTPSYRSLSGVEELPVGANSPEQAEPDGEETGEKEEVEEEKEEEGERGETKKAEEEEEEEEGEEQSIQWSEEQRQSAVSGQSFRTSGLSLKATDSQVQTQMGALSVDVEPTPSQEEPPEEDGSPAPADVVDLQQYAPLGGVLYFDLFRLPPQARHVNGWEMRQVLKTGLQVFPYPTEVTGGSAAAAPDDLEPIAWPPIDVSVKLPDSALFLESPLVVRWDAADKQWRRDGITEVSYEEEEAKISFKMDAFCPVVLMQDMYANLPFKQWDLRPLDQDSALFTIAGAHVELSITIKGNQCMLQLNRDKVLAHLTGTWMSAPALQRAALQCGVNIFVNEHTEKYVHACDKDPLTEHAAYEQMALLASACAFSWSRWNAKCGAEHLVLQVCEHLVPAPVPQAAWDLYLLSAQRSQRLKMGEDSPEFSPEHRPGSEFHSTLVHMLRADMSAEGVARTTESGYLFVDTVQSLLCSTRPLIYS